MICTARGRWRRGKRRGRGFGWLGLGRGDLLGVNEERRGHGGWGEEWRGEGADDGGDIIWGEADGGGEMVVVAEVAVGGVEADPAGAWEVDFGPGVEGAIGDFLMVIEFAEVAAGESGGEAEGASGIGEEDGVIAAGTGAEGEGFGGWSGGAIFASGVGDILVDGGVETDEGFDGGGWRGRRGRARRRWGILWRRTSVLSRVGMGGGWGRRSRSRS